MSRRSRVLAIDQGTTSTRAMLFDGSGRSVATSRRPHPQSYPASGLVEHDPTRIWNDTVDLCREVLDRAGAAADDVAAIGITNQRETVVLWDRATGEPVHPAIVWQDRRTAETCERLRDEGREEVLRSKTGLLLDPYFSATKVKWLLDHVEGARPAAEAGELAFGTVDSWLLWNLTGGEVHATDATNASRTLLFDIHEQTWDEDLLRLFGVPRAILPEVRDSSGLFGHAEPELLGREIPVTGIAGDQQAATFGQAAFGKGLAKLTCGTGAFLLLNTGERAIASEHRLLTTVAWRLDEEVTYALEGSVFSAGSAVEWLRDGLGLVDDVADSEALARRARPDSSVRLVPAFTGLGAPHWDPHARAALVGLTRDTGADEIARATLEALAFQTADLVEAMEEDSGIRPATLRVDGGMSDNAWAMGFLADVLDLPVERPVEVETTALGAACLAGLEVGVYGGLDAIRSASTVDARWEPSLDAERRASLMAGWRDAVERVLETSET
ncbi:MAG: glycerol kinase GlpK [Gemmatimonadota bacterium]